MKKEYKLYILSTTTEEGGELCEGEEDVPYASHEPTYRMTTFDTAHGSQPADRMFYDTLEVSKTLYEELMKCEKVFVSAIFYSDGDTFGTTDGYYEITGVSSTKEDAAAANKAALESNDFQSWQGYFARLIGPEIFLVPFVK